jgi:glycosyltransferase involved in cell wall biosynthesis
VGQSVETADIEVLLVDNNSDTDSIEQVHRDFRDLLTITLVQQPRLGHPFALSRAHNTALRLVAGEWISSIDADCIPSPDFLRSIYAAIDRAANRPFMFTGERIFILASNLTKRKLIDEPSTLLHLPNIPSVSNYYLANDRRLPAMKQMPDVAHPWAYMHGGNLLYRTIDAELVHGHNERFDGTWGYEDADFAYRMIVEASCEARYLSGMTVYHQEPGFRTFKIEQYGQLV